MCTRLQYSMSARGVMRSHLNATYKAPNDLCIWGLGGIYTVGLGSFGWWHLGISVLPSEIDQLKVHITLAG